MSNEIVDKRVALYGDPVEVNVRIAQVWSGIIGHEIQPVEVPLMMAGLKLVRAQVTPDYSDSSDDVHGWTHIFELMVGEDMIHARTPAEYWAQKDPVPYTLTDQLLAGVRAAADLTTVHTHGGTDCGGGDDCPMNQP